MSGAEIVGTLLRAHEPLVAVIEPKWIKLGALPEGAPMNAVLIRTVSVVDQQFLRQGVMVRSTERTAVAVRAENYRLLKQLIGMVRACCHDVTLASMGTAERIAIRTNGRGPDLFSEAGSFEQTIDFRVSFDAPV